MAVLLDTSVLIAAEKGPDEDAAISVVSLTELHFGVLIARDEETRALRMRRLGAIEDHFDALPFDAVVARECVGCTPLSRNAVKRHGGEQWTWRSPPQPTSTASRC